MTLEAFLTDVARARGAFINGKHLAQVRVGDTLVQDTVTNVFANASFSGAGPLVEVRRNYIPDPRFAASGWGVVGATSVSSGGALTLTSTVSTSGNMIVGPTTMGADLLGVPVSMSWLVTNLGSTAFGVQPRFYNGASYTDGTSVSIPAGETRLVKIENRTITGSYVQPRLWQINPTVGGSVRVSEPILERGATVGPFFYVGGPSIDSDMTASWLGAVAASPTILTGVGVPEVTANTNCIAIRSTQWASQGTHSLRLIPTTSSNNSYVDLGSAAAPPTPPGQLVTLAAVRRLAAPLTGTLLRAGSVSIYDGNFQTSPALPNVAGAATTRISAVAGSSAATRRAMLHHGGALGSGDVWWDLATLVAGNYPGKPASGDSPGWAWDGPPHNSTSHGWR